MIQMFFNTEYQLNTLYKIMYLNTKYIDMYSNTFANTFLNTIQIKKGNDM